MTSAIQFRSTIPFVLLLLILAVSDASHSSKASSDASHSSKASSHTSHSRKASSAAASATSVASSSSNDASTSYQTSSPPAKSTLPIPPLIPSPIPPLIPSPIPPLIPSSIPPLIPPPPPPRDQSSAGAGTIDPYHAEYNGDALASQFLYAHNKIRAKYYLPALRWNRTLARFARHYADIRMKDCLPQHSHHRSDGENLFWSKYGHWTPANVVKTWGDEHKYYDFESNQCVQGQPCGHFTQIIWKNTTDVGCGRVQCLNDKGFLYVCKYDPPGNYYFEGPFGGKFANSIVT
ncbi:Pathogenesis-related protein PR-1 [Linum perenne]